AGSCAPDEPDAPPLLSRSWLGASVLDSWNAPTQGPFSSTDSAANPCQSVPEREPRTGARGSTLPSRALRRLPLGGTAGRVDARVEWRLHPALRDASKSPHHAP